MTELEQARANLREWQRELADARDHIKYIKRRWILKASIANLKWYEDQVLAALSWVWDAQERHANTPDAVPSDFYRNLVHLWWTDHDSRTSPMASR